MVTRQDMLDQGYIRVQVHLDDSRWKIYNYTEKAAWERKWNEHTLECRGLIEVDGAVAARPFPKFFNSTEPDAPHIGLNEEVDVYDKADGSLGILYTAPDGLPAIATRGSFASEQAIWATEFLRESYLSYDWGSDVFTPLFEIIYPENRIVLDYQGYEGLIFLGAIHTKFGHYVSSEDYYQQGFEHLTRTEYLGAMSYAEALELPNRSDREGVVIRTRDDRVVKVKQQDYVDLHRIITNLTPKNTWARVKELGGDFSAWIPEGLFEGVPNEFHELIEEQARELEFNNATLILDVNAEGLLLGVEVISK